MIRTISMLILSIVVAGAMGAILKIFLGRLVKIEKEMWGAKARTAQAARKSAGDAG